MSGAEILGFAAPSRRGKSDFVVDLDGYGGPIDLLLQLARDQKVDLVGISILQLAEQYLEFIRQARELRLEVAADYLVMAAWLAYLKSKLLLPAADNEDEPSGTEMAAALRYQLRRLEAMRQAGKRLMMRPQLGQDVFARGTPEAFRTLRTSSYDASLFDLMKAYGGQRSRAKASSLRIMPTELYSVDAALKRLSGLFGQMPEWRNLLSFLPSDLADSLLNRSAIASTFAASLELCRTGRVELRQDGVFGPIYLRQKGERE